MTRQLDDSPSGDGPPSLADDALLAAFRETDDPVLTTDEVGDSVPFRRVPTVEGLERLAGEGVLERKSVGDESVWWLPGHTGTDERDEPMPGVHREFEGGLPRRVENEISTLSAPDEPERAAIYAACHCLAERGPSSGETIRDEVYPEHDADYDDAETWWRESIRPALAALSGVERTGDEWRIAD